MSKTITDRSNRVYIWQAKSRFLTQNEQRFGFCTEDIDNNLNVKITKLQSFIPMYLILLRQPDFPFLLLSLMMGHIFFEIFKDYLHKALLNDY